MAEARPISREKLTTFLRSRTAGQSVDRASGLVILAVYEGMLTRIKSGEFDEEVKDGPTPDS